MQSRLERVEISGEILATPKDELAPLEWKKLALLLLLVLGCLLPFLNKPVHVDDPVYIWVARQICLKPWDFYGFDINWYGLPFRTAQFMMNPPLISFYLAAIGKLFGWSEMALHTAMLLPALLATAGIYGFARRMCAYPALATAIAVLSPVFVVSGTTIMCDVAMVCLWIWAIVFWMDGVRLNSQWRLALASVLILLAILTKYFAISAIPLLAVYSVIKWQKWRIGILWMIVPFAGAMAYQLYTNHQYGNGLLGTAMLYAVGSRSDAGRFAGPRLLTGFSFVGGCLATALPTAIFIFVSKLRNKRGWILPVILIGMLVILFLSNFRAIERSSLTGPLNFGTRVQLVSFAFSGILIAWLAISSKEELRRADTWLLALTVAGTFMFAVQFNWGVSARVILPMAPAIGVLAVRRLDSLGQLATVTSRRNWSLVIFAMAGLSIAVAAADQGFARTAKQATAMIAAKSPVTSNLRFEGHWGFQYYMQNAGFQPLNGHGETMAADQVLINPLLSSNHIEIPNQAVQQTEAIELPASWGIVSMDLNHNAGFYFDGWGPLPFAFGKVSVDRYQVYQITKAVQFHM